ncbi:MAG: 50S ribosomal protein L36 [Oscillospiraceae bacterium]|nr:50S ribosomal protein L36 [Oscillospiraceae bacterium]
MAYPCSLLTHQLRTEVLHQKQHTRGIHRSDRRHHGKSDRIHSSRYDCWYHPWKNFCRRKGRLYVINKKNPKFKTRQG